VAWREESHGSGPYDAGDSMMSKVPLVFIESFIIMAEPAKPTPLKAAIQVSPAKIWESWGMVGGMPCRRQYASQRGRSSPDVDIWMPDLVFCFFHRNTPH